jgi:dipeptidyl aminopeptidase/acylaminoacyl peptidase
VTTPFHDIRDYLAIPRLTGIRLAPSGDSLVATVQTLTADKTKHVTALWRLDPRGEAAPVRLTRSAPGETGPAFLPDGSVLFLSRRPAPDRAAGKRAEAADSDDVAALWLLPAAGGEARRVASRPGGIDAFAVARSAGTVAFTSPTLPGAADDDAGRRKARTDAKVSAILHEGHPVRHWDHDLGPAELRLFATAVEPAAVEPGAVEPAAPEPRDLTPRPGRALDEQPFAVAPDGRTVVTGWTVSQPRGESRMDLVAIDVATGERRTLVSDPGADYMGPVVSPDGRTVVCRRAKHGNPREPFDETLWLGDLEPSGAGRDLLPDFDLWPFGPVWSADSSAVYFVADRRGRRPVFRVDVATGEVAWLTRDDWSYDQLQPSPDGRYVYALRSGIGGPPQAVRIDAATGEVTVLRSPGTPVELPGRVTEITATAGDGAEIRGWLVLPETREPAPLLLWVHGGPYMSWNDWSWRWNHWVMAAHGYAVLLPDPAPSTGYGAHMIRRGYGDWGPRTYADVMAITDAAVARDDIDETRTAMMGGSFGGYMANWIAGHTDRFAAIVSHASLWEIRSMMATSDEAIWGVREFGDPVDEPAAWDRNDPSRHVANIRTPMLVIHGAKDYRVPIGNALWLWWDLIRHEVAAKFLYFPDENHWVLTPGNSVVWYETVLAFLAHHVRGEEWKRPELL